MYGTVASKAYYDIYEKGGTQSGFRPFSLEYSCV